MARRALGPATLAVVAAVADAHDGEDVVVACSGGADSLALAFAARVVAARRGVGVRAVVVDHGLQAGSAEHAAAVVDGLGRLELAAEGVTVEVRDDGSGPEAAARAARYAALTASLRPGEECHLGHTRDDQAETVLLGLARGSGVRSLAGMPGRRDRFVRPLLGLPRSVTRDSCAELGLRTWQDPHNAELRFTRARVRHTVLPVIEAELGPGIAAALARTADLAREDADALDAVAAQVPTPDELPCDAVADLPAGVRLRVLRRWLRARGAGELSRGHTLAVDALITGWHGQRWVEVPGLRVLRRDGRLLAFAASAR